MEVDIGPIFYQVAILHRCHEVLTSSVTVLNRNFDQKSREILLTFSMFCTFLDTPSLDISVKIFFDLQNCVIWFTGNKVNVFPSEWLIVRLKATSWWRHVISNPVKPFSQTSLLPKGLDQKVRLCVFSALRMLPITDVQSKLNAMFVLFFALSLLLGL